MEQIYVNFSYYSLFSSEKKRNIFNGLWISWVINCNYLRITTSFSSWNTNNLTKNIQFTVKNILFERTFLITPQQNVLFLWESGCDRRKLMNTDQEMIFTEMWRRCTLHTYCSQHRKFHILRFANDSRHYSSLPSHRCDRLPNHINKWKHTVNV